MMFDRWILWKSFFFLLDKSNLTQTIAGENIRQKCVNDGRVNKLFNFS